MHFIEESQLITRLKSGDQSAVARWYAQSKADLLRFFLSKVPIEADAQELVHDTYMSCLASLPLFRGQSGLWTFMISIAKHELADYWRKRYAKRAIALLPFGEDLLSTVQHGGGEPLSTQATQEVTQLLEKLPQEISELLQLKYVDGLSVKDLAKRYGLSHSAMQSKLFRAKELFKEQYERRAIS